MYFWELIVTFITRMLFKYYVQIFRISKQPLLPVTPFSYTFNMCCLKQQGSLPLPLPLFSDIIFERTQILKMVEIYRFLIHSHSNLRFLNTLDC